MCYICELKTNNEFALLCYKVCNILKIKNFSNYTESMKTLKVYSSKF